MKFDFLQTLTAFLLGIATYNALYAPIFARTQHVFASHMIGVILGSIVAYAITTRLNR